MAARQSHSAIRVAMSPDIRQATADPHRRRLPE
jgi:hypothetical protein